MSQISARPEKISLFALDESFFQQVFLSHNPIKIATFPKVSIFGFFACLAFWWVLKIYRPENYHDNGKTTI